MTVDHLISLLGVLDPNMPIYINGQNVDREIEVHPITPHAPDNLIGYIIAEKRPSGILAKVEDAQLSFDFDSEGD